MGDPAGEIEKLRARLARERAARRDAESIAEAATANLYRKHRELLLMQRIAAAANSASDQAQAFQTAVSLICDHIGWPIGHLYLRDGDELRPSKLWHLSDPDRHGGFRDATERTTLRLGVGLPGRVAAGGRPVWIADLDKDPNFPRRAALVALGIRCGFAFPITSGDEIVAVAEFFSLMPSDPDEGLLEAAGYVGDQLGRVIERKRAEDRLVHDALHDGLTGLPNRALLLDRLALAIARARRDPAAGFALMHIDTDRFKVVNDSLGHLAGDALLKALGARLVGCIRQYDTLARLGGDEFTVLLESVSSGREAVAIAERIHRALDAPFPIEGHDVFVTVSIGLVLSDPSYQRPDELLRDADTALYRAKAAGRARHEVFDTSMHQHAVGLLRLENDLRRAIERDELVLVYQPIVDLHGGALCGFEALLRWRHPERGMVSPAEFIPLAEETGLIVPIGRWVMDEACRQLRRWSPIADGITISVNVAARQFREPGLVADVLRSAAAAEVALDRLKLELTESAVIEHAGAEAILTELEGRGVRLMLDDFGTGYSSLSHLHRFPISTIKIDGSFVRRMAEGGKQLEIVRTILLLASSLGMEVIAEGVETAEQRDLLGSLGCVLAQGFLFSRPVAADAAEAYLRGRCPWQPAAS